MAPKAILGHNKTSTNGPSEKRTTSAQRTAHLPPVDFTIELIHFKPPGNFVLAKVRWGPLFGVERCPLLSENGQRR